MEPVKRPIIAMKANLTKLEKEVKGLEKEFIKLDFSNMKSLKGFTQKVVALKTRAQADTLFRQLALSSEKGQSKGLLSAFTKSNPNKLRRSVEFTQFANRMLAKLNLSEKKGTKAKREQAASAPQAAAAVVMTGPPAPKTRMDVLRQERENLIEDFKAAKNKLNPDDDDYYVNMEQLEEMHVAKLQSVTIALQAPAGASTEGKPTITSNEAESILPILIASKDTKSSFQKKLTALQDKLESEINDIDDDLDYDMKVSKLKTESSKEWKSLINIAPELEAEIALAKAISKGASLPPEDAESKQTFARLASKVAEIRAARLAR